PGLGPSNSPWKSCSSRATSPASPGVACRTEGRAAPDGWLDGMGPRLIALIDWPINQEDPFPMFVFKAAVLGGGTMGGEIAQVIANADIPVIVKDVEQTFVEHALEKSREVTKSQLN